MATNSHVEPSILCLGPTGSGKTLLLKELQCENSVDMTTTSVPTIGTNIVHIKWKRKVGEFSTETELTVRELGGTMSPLWPKYLHGTKKVMYVVDTSNLCQISAAGVLLYTLLSHPELEQTKFLLVLTKMDVSYRQMRNEALLMLQMTRLSSEIKQTMQIIEASAIDGEGRVEILQWLFSK